MDKILWVDGKEVGVRATALTPRLYRHKFGRDIVRDMNQLHSSYMAALRAQGLQKPADDAPDYEKQNYQEAMRHAELDALDLEIFENIAWIMVRQYDPTAPDTPEAWLDSIDGTFSVYEVLPQILELWQSNQTMTSRPKKK